jgi:hypothetical protein
MKSREATRASKDASGNGKARTSPFAKKQLLNRSVVARWLARRSCRSERSIPTTRNWLKIPARRQE